MKTIELSLFKHKGLHQIKVAFDYDYNTKEYVKQYALVKWSKTHKTFYLPFSKENTNEFYKYLKLNNFKVDYSKLTSSVVITPKIKPEVKESIIQFKHWLLQMRYSDNTIKTYISMLKLFFTFHHTKTASEIQKKDIEEFNNDYVIKKKLSYTYQNQLVNAVKLFYKYETNLLLNLEDIDRPKKSKKLPEVLSINEVKMIINTVNNLKHKTLISLLYSCGLRIGEALALQLNAIDLNRKLLHVKSGKGKKDRFVPLSTTMITLLNKYITGYKPQLYLFSGQNNPYYSSVSARKILNRAVQLSNIEKNVTLHTLRHSYATHLLENGTDIRFIQELLGHSSPKTTMIYTHVSTTSLEKIKNPFDDFEI